EEVVLVDETGRLYDGADLLTMMVNLFLQTGAKGVFAVPVSAPSAIELTAHEKGCSVRRTKNSERSMIEAALSPEVIMAGSMDGRFAFTKFQSAFDGMFTIAKALELLATLGTSFSKILEDVPRRTFLQTRVPCVWEMKGGIMRKMSEDSLDEEATFIDGIKVHFGEDWVLVLPDQYRPLVHIFAEAKQPKTAQRLLDEYLHKVEKWKKELQ
ncbi:MAG TPA: phosphoglucomutase, partial [Geobacteraceae bacterium]|nr:phosphoglucomutase [Geobacteraceae bacterium]